MRSSFYSVRPAALCLGLLALGIMTALGQGAAPGIKLETILVWGCNDEKSPNPSHKPVDTELRKKFDKMPLKYKSYFEVKRSDFTIFTNQYTLVDVDTQCRVEVKDLGGQRVKVKLYGMNKEVTRHEKALPPGETLVFGGDDKNDNSKSAWFVIIRHPQASPPVTKAAPVPPAPAAPLPPK